MSAMDNTSASNRRSNRNTNRYSVNHLFSMRAEQDVEIEDDLARGPLGCSLLIVDDCTLIHLQRKNDYAS